MASINPYLTFDGDCRAAMSFYRDCLGGELTLTVAGETPAASQLPKEAQTQIMHALLRSDSVTLMASDRMGYGKQAEDGNIGLMVQCSSEDEIKSAFSKLSAGGSVTTALKEEFWGAIYGDITDKFGVRWMFNYDKPKT